MSLRHDAFGEDLSQKLCGFCDNRNVTNAVKPIDKAIICPMRESANSLAFALRHFSDIGSPDAIRRGPLAQRARAKGIGGSCRHQGWWRSQAVIMEETVACPARKMQARLIQPRWGWEYSFWMTRGRPAMRSNPGLNYGIPLGFSKITAPNPDEGHKISARCSRLQGWCPPPEPSRPQRGRSLSLGQQSVLHVLGALGDRRSQGGIVAPQQPGGLWIWIAGKTVSWKTGRMKTTLEIPDSLFKQVKARAAMEGLKLKDLVASALDAYMARPRSGPPEPAKPCPFPLVRGKGGPLMRRMSGETIARLEEREDVERHRRSLGR